MAPCPLLPVAALLLLGGPMLGVWLAGKPLDPYLAFPPRNEPAEVPGFSWPVFACMLAFVALALAPFVWRWHTAPSAAHDMRRRRVLPAWGWGALIVLGGSWTLAWTRFPWFEPLQAHTYTPLWLGYIGLVNALTVRRQGSSLVTRHPVRFALLFPASALFWWFFEYLNRYVDNWQYFGVSAFTPSEYFMFASVSFSTVLPAVASTAEWLGTFTRMHAAFGRWRAIRPAHPRAMALTALAVTAVSLVGLGLWPQLLYPLVWIAPALAIVSLQAITGRCTVLAPLQCGDWRTIVSYAAAALLCGFFWELWNAGSLAHWEYAVPYVDRFRIFEMPLLGYAGYLPFGVECAVISHLVLREHAELSGSALPETGRQAADSSRLNP